MLGSFVGISNNNRSHFITIHKTYTLSCNQKQRGHATQAQTRSSRRGHLLPWPTALQTAACVSTSLSVVLTHDIFLHVRTMQKSSHHRVNTHPWWRSQPDHQKSAHHTKTIADTELPAPHNPIPQLRERYPQRDCLGSSYFFRTNPLLHFSTWIDVTGIRPFSCW